ncbi:MAG: DNA topoisomerase 3 [Paludibacteraceae bacterium]|nr:DNA topoisomerase 3 [Paludibacteraceae bacterium]
MIVCIAEKPSVAREIAAVLGATQKRDGYMEGNGYQVTWTYGHLCSLKEPHEYNERWKAWRMSEIPMIPDKFGIKVMDDAGVQKQFKVIEKLFNEADEIINCGDAGQEGEVIQRWVLQCTKAKKPVKRLWISSLTEEAIKEGFNNLYDSSKFDTLFAAGCARAIGDWLLGINATRLYTIKYGNGKGVLSVGRVQTPTLALVVKRQKEIDNFVPQPYWELKTVYRNATFSVKQGRFDKKEDAEKALQDIEGKEFEVTSVEKKNGKELAPRLFDLTSLQVECNKRFGYSAEKTLQIIQSLYEKKLATYPRVDTTYLPNDVYPKVPQILAGLTPYQKFTEPLKGVKLRKDSTVFNDKKVTDHHAIIPTGKFFNNFTPDEKWVYDIIVRRFIAVFYPDCKVANTVVEGKSADVEFRVSGKVILEPGWRALFPNDKAEKKDDEADVLPDFTKGEKGPHTPSLAEKMTQPPKYYSEASLLRAMETAGKSVDDDELRDLMKENGIGRPSTRAAIIETLFKRNYIVRDKKRIVATRTGIELIDTIENELLKSATLTGMWEKKMRDIEHGTYSMETFMGELKSMVQEVSSEVKNSQGKKIDI